MALPKPSFDENGYSVCMQSEMGEILIPVSIFCLEP